jgi:hypothetical protein
MPNSLTAAIFKTNFAPKTTIKSSEVNQNFETIRDAAPLWQKYTIDFSTFVALGGVAAGTVTAFQLQSDEVINAVMVKHSALFGGGAISAAKVKVGITGDNSRYVDEFDVNQAVAAGANQIAQTMDCQFAATNIIVVLSLTGGNLNGLSTGSIDIYVQKAELPS